MITKKYINMIYEEIAKYLIKEKDQDLVIIKDLDVLFVYIEQNIEDPICTMTSNEEECRELIAYFMGKNVDKEKIEYFEQFEEIKKKMDYNETRDMKRFISGNNNIFEEIYFGKFVDNWLEKIEGNIFYI